MTIERSKERIKQRGEVFTPIKLVNKILDKLPQHVFDDDRTNTFIDPAAGSGNFLTQVIKRKLKHGATPHQALRTTYGVDLMPDNVMLCRTRLLEGALGRRFSTDLSNEWRILEHEKATMYVLYRLAGTPHNKLMHHTFDPNNDELKQYINPDIKLLTPNRYPPFKEFVQYMTERMGKTYNTTRTEYYVIRNPHNRATGKNLNLLNQLHLVRRVFYNIVCADSLTEWDFENWCSNQLLEF